MLTPEEKKVAHAVYMRKWNADHREILNQRRKDRRKNDPEYRAKIHKREQLRETRRRQDPAYVTYHSRLSQAYKQRNPEKTKTWSHSAARKPKHRFNHAVSRAKYLNLEWTLTLEQHQLLLATGKCFYCPGLLPATGVGLDRIDHLRGYLPDNVVPCCASCNRLKGRIEGLGFVYPRTVELLNELLKEGSTS